MFPWKKAFRFSASGRVLSELSLRFVIRKQPIHTPG